MPEGGIITGIAFRLDESIDQPLSVVLPEIEIRISTTPRSVYDFSFIFAENVGPDETIVFTRGPARLEPSTSPEVPRPFSQFIPLNKPFEYDPRKGGLAVDLLNFQLPTGTPGSLLIDAAGTGTVALAGSVGIEVAHFALAGLIIELQFTPIPEPAALSLLGVGGIILLLENTFRRKEEHKA